MTDEEITIRKPVWVAMSDLFLDTDVRVSYCSIARTLAAAPFTIEQMGAILNKEVSPIAAPNLMVVAGEWGGFDEEWLVSRITARLEGALRMPSSFGSVARADWDAVVVLITRLRRLAEADRPRQLALWDELLKLFLDRVPPIPPKRPDGWSNEELEAVWRDEMWPSYGRSAELYRKHNSSGYPSKDEIERAWTQWKNAVS